MRQSHSLAEGVVSVGSSPEVRAARPKCPRPPAPPTHPTPPHPHPPTVPEVRPPCSPRASSLGPRETPGPPACYREALPAPWYLAPKPRPPPASHCPGDAAALHVRSWRRASARAAARRPALLRRRARAAAGRKHPLTPWAPRPARLLCRLRAHSLAQERTGAQPRPPSQPQEAPSEDRPLSTNRCRARARASCMAAVCDSRSSCREIQSRSARVPLGSACSTTSPASAPEAPPSVPSTPEPARRVCGIRPCQRRRSCQPTGSFGDRRRSLSTVASR